MTRLDDFHNNKKDTDKRREIIRDMENEIHSMAYSLSKGCTLEEYMDSQQYLVDILKELNQSA